MKYAIIDDLRKLVETREYDILPPHKSGRILPIVDDAFPVVTVTQKIVPGEIVIQNADALQTWSVVNKTAEELRKTWSAMEFLLRFTAEERAALRAQAAIDPVTADFLQLVQAAQQVENDHPLTIQGMGYLVTLGIITQERSNEVLE